MYRKVTLEDFIKLKTQLRSEMQAYGKLRDEGPRWELVCHGAVIREEGRSRVGEDLASNECPEGDRKCGERRSRQSDARFRDKY